MNELREVLAIVPGDTNWKSDNQVNSVYHALTCCESLVIVAEEERTVHFVHQSVVQFLLDKKSTSAALRFSLAQASLELGEICVTYLNYGIFDQRVSTNLVPTVPAGLIPAKVAQDTLKGSGIVGQLALMLLNLQSTNGPDMGKVLAETSHLYRKRQESSAFEFLKYASQHWLIHTTRIDDTRSTFRLWKSLLQHSKFDGLFWGPNEIHPDKLLVDGQSGNIWTLPPRVTWAISRSHLPLLLFELRSRRGLRAFCSIVPYIRVLVRGGDGLKVDGAMALKLFEMAVVAGADDIASLLLRTHQASCSRETFLEPFLKRSDLARVSWVISLRSFGSLNELKFPIVEFAFRARNLQLLALALDLGARIDFYHENPLVLLVERMQDPMDLALACRLLKARFPLKGCNDMPERLYWLLHYYTIVNRPDDFDPHRTVVGSLGNGYGSISKATYESLVRRACSNGNLQMMQKLFSPEVKWPSFATLIYIRPENFFLWMMDALCTYSTDRVGIVQLLGRVLDRYLEQIRSRTKTDRWHPMWLDIFRRCLQLRAWKMAETVRRVPYLQAACFKKQLLNFDDGNKEADEHHASPTTSDVAQRWLGTTREVPKQAETSTDASAKNTLRTDEYERGALKASNQVSLVHLSASCGDVAGLGFLLDVLGTDAHTLLSALSPLDSCFGGDVPLQTLLDQEQSKIEETASFLRIGDTILKGIGAHGTSACGQRPRSCLELAPRFCVKVIQSITGIRRGREVLFPGRRPYRFLNPERRPYRVLDDLLQSKRCFPLFEKFLKTWLAHIPRSANLRGLLLPMLDAIVRDFGEVKAELEAHLPRDEDRLEPLIKKHSRDHIQLGFILAQSMGEEGIDDMLEHLLFHDPFLQDDIAGFKESLFQEYNV